MPNPIDLYIAAFPEKTQLLLQKVRAIIKEIIPQAEEIISYGIPTFNLNKTHVVHFAAFKNHLGFFPTPSAISAFTKELENYKTSKGTIQFLYNQEIPYDLIKKIVAFRLKEVEKSI